MQNKRTAFEGQFHIIYKKPGPISQLVEHCHQVCRAFK